MTSSTVPRAAARRARVARERGVSLVELVVAMSIVALAAGGIYALVTVGNRSTIKANDFLHIQTQVRAALDNVLDETRWAQRASAASGTSVTLLVPQATPFSAASPYLVTFAYDAAGQTVTRQEDPDATGPQPARPAEPLAYSVVTAGGGAGLSFEYFDALGASLGSTPADLNAVVRLRMTVTVTRNGVSRTFSGDVALRGR
ncbi:MAG: prepilin-type N-terminal cleavage/methylation domain-containing protein [Armatimonadota bacterium]|nr:prepilin-type N-terminal cleavage/methylation domain-containing protein [Armatimonadota bacterium]